MSHMVGLPQIPFFSMHEYPLNYAISLFILTLITLFIGKDILRNGYKNLIKLSTIQSERNINIQDIEKHNYNLVCIIPYESNNLYE